MSSLTVQRPGAFTAYVNPTITRSLDGSEGEVIFDQVQTTDDLPPLSFSAPASSQVESTHDPFGLRERYASRQDVIDTLDKIDEALALSDFNPDKNRLLNFSGMDFRPLRGLLINPIETLNLERLLIASQKVSQYPLFRANLDGANLTRISLERADLGGSSFRGVDFTGAILSEASLVGTDLREAFAVVRGERLTGNALRNYLVNEFNVVINDETKF